MTNPRSTYSNRAHAYCERVVSGEQIASKWIKLAAQQHIADLANRNSRWHYDTERVERCCSFIEALTLSTGALFKLSDWQVWIVASLIGWIDEGGTRKHIEALILVPKGNGKSPLAAALGLWFAFFDGAPKAEVFCGALSMAQAQEVHTPARAFVDEQPAFAELGITAQKRSIFNAQGAKFQPVIGRGRHGARPYLAILDELHQALGPDLYNTFKSGCNKVINSLLLVISTAGVAAQDNPCYQLQERAQKALQGTLPDDRLFAAIYCADDSVPWTSDEAIRMANPNLGVSNDAEKIRLAVASAVRKPAEQNNTKAMHLNVWSTAASAWANMEQWKKAVSPLTPDDCKHLPCVIGSDLASKLDLSALTLLFRDDSKGPKPVYHAFTKAYLPEARVQDPALTHYARWVAEGALTQTDGSSMDYALLEVDALGWIETYQVRELAYDARYADQWSQRVSELSGVTRVETPPSPAVLSPPMKEIEAAVADGRLFYDGNPVMTWCMSNVLTRETPAGNYTMPTKSRPESKIDCAVSLFIAMSRAMVMPTNTAPTFGFVLI